MTHNEQSSIERRKFLTGLGTATVGAVAASVVGRATVARATAAACFPMYRMGCAC